MHQVASAGWHLVAIGYAVFVACSTALPTGTNLWFLVFDVEQLVTPRFVGKLVVVSAFVGGLSLAVLTWRRRQIWMSRLSWPLVGYIIVCGVGLATLVLISQPPRYLARVGLGELRGIAVDLDVRHMISYFGFAVIVAIAWRGRVSLPVLGVLLMAYGYCLELVQEFVPSRNFRIKDLVSNGLGILLGLCWVYLYDSLFGAQGTGLSRLARRRRRRRALARRSGMRAGMQPRRS
jgi:hypothetical protein